MKIIVRVKPGSRKKEVVKISEGSYLVAVSEPPVEGRANKAVVGLLADYFGIAKSKVRIMKGETAKIKMVEVDV